MIIIAYYSNTGYKFMADRLGRILAEWGVPYKTYNREWIEETSFYGYHRDILDSPRGNGYWAWKPYIIADALAFHDPVIYMDSSVIPDSLEAINEIISATKDVGAIETEFFQRVWTKKSCFENMNCDEEKYWNAHQVWAGVVVAKRSGSHIIDEWFYHCSRYSTISDEPCKNNFKGFKDHRHDQSVLTNVLIKHNQPLLHSLKFKDCVQYG